MARLPSDKFLIQMIGDDTVLLFEQYTEREIVRFAVKDSHSFAAGQRMIYQNEELSTEDKAFAHFWCGYFYAHAVHS
jgi:hypothetical protein